MAEVKVLVDEFGVIREAAQILPSDKLKAALLEALAELESHEAHRTRSFPKTRLHKVAGYQQVVYRADIDKISGWRLHVQYEEGAIHLKDVIEGQRHDDVLKVIHSRRSRYR